MWGEGRLLYLILRIDIIDRIDILDERGAAGVLLEEFIASDN